MEDVQMALDDLMEVDRAVPTVVQATPAPTPTPDATLESGRRSQDQVSGGDSDLHAEVELPIDLSNIFNMQKLTRFIHLEPVGCAA